MKRQHAVELVLIKVKVGTDPKHIGHIGSANCHTCKCQKQWHLHSPTGKVPFGASLWQLCHIGEHLKDKLDNYVHLHFILDDVIAVQLIALLNKKTLCFPIKPFCTLT